MRAYVYYDHRKLFEIELKGNCWRFRKKYTLIARDTNFNRALLFGSVYVRTSVDSVWLTITYRDNVTVSLNKLPDCTYSRCGNYLTSYFVANA